MTQFEKAKQEINSHPLSDYYNLTRSPKAGIDMYCCPICKSGTGAHKTGTLKLYHNNGTWTVYCAKGCFGGDGRQAETTLDALCRIKGEKAVDIMREYGYIDNSRENRRESSSLPAGGQRTEPQMFVPKDYTDQYKGLHENLLGDPVALKYLMDQRGLSRRAIDYFNLGYNPEWTHPKNPRIKLPGIIIPYSANMYKVRRIDNGEEHKYMRCGTGAAILNDAAIYDNYSDINGNIIDKMNPILVLEGDFDCMAVWPFWQRVVSISGTSGINIFTKIAKERNPAATYILALDNDDAGRKAQKALEKEMADAGLYFISTDTAKLYGEYKDAGEATQDEAFRDRLRKYIYDGRDQREERETAAAAEAYQHSGPGMVDVFLETVKTNRYEPIPTGFKSFDSIIGGGFIRKQIVMLAAAPGMGKTTLATQICESIAESGTDVLYINLEMDREQLLARSIARIAWTPATGDFGNSMGNPLTAINIMQGYKWTPDQCRIILDAAEKYKRTIAQHLVYNPGDLNCDIDAILKKMNDEKNRLGHAPIVCVDYLQLLTGGEHEDVIAVIKRALQRLKEWAMQNNSVVIIITATNRDSMKTGSSGLNSGRDTSNIEFAADLHLGLSYSMLGERYAGIDKITKDDIEKAREKYLVDKNNDKARENYEKLCTKYTLKVNKGRFVDSGSKVTLHFDGARSRFWEVDNRITAPPQATRKKLEAAF